VQLPFTASCLEKAELIVQTRQLAIAQLIGSFLGVIVGGQLQGNIFLP